MLRCGVGRHKQCNSAQCKVPEAELQHLLWMRCSQVEYGIKRKPILMMNWILENQLKIYKYFSRPQESIKVTDIQNLGCFNTKGANYSPRGDLLSGRRFGVQKFSTQNRPPGGTQKTSKMSFGQETFGVQVSMTAFSPFFFGASINQFHQRSGYGLQQHKMEKHRMRAAGRHMGQGVGQQKEDGP